MIALSHKPAGTDGNMEMLRMMSFGRLSVFVFVVLRMNDRMFHLLMLPVNSRRKKLPR